MVNWWKASIIKHTEEQFLLRRICMVSAKGGPASPTLGKEIENAVHAVI